MPWAPKLISALLVYGLIPLLVIDKVLRAEPAELAVIPPMMFVVAALMALPAHWLSKRHGDDFDPQLLSASFSFFNVAFFGMPVASALFGEAAVSTIICAFVGTALYGDTIGYYRVARTRRACQGRVKGFARSPILRVRRGRHIEAVRGSGTAIAARTGRYGVDPRLDPWDGCNWLQSCQGEGR
ncbi:hypothetical protein P0F65_07045 [Sphingomonas sp. I4]